MRFISMAVLVARNWDPFVFPVYPEPTKNIKPLVCEVWCFYLSGYSVSERLKPPLKPFPSTASCYSNSRHTNRHSQHGHHHRSSTDNWVSIVAPSKQGHNPLHVFTTCVGTRYLVQWFEQWLVCGWSVQIILVNWFQISPLKDELSFYISFDRPLFLGKTW